MDEGNEKTLMLKCLMTFREWNKNYILKFEAFQFSNKNEKWNDNCLFGFKAV